MDSTTGRRPAGSLARCLLVIVLLPSTACHRWAPTDVRPAMMEDGRVKRLRVTTEEARIILHRPAIVMDSLVGFEKAQWSAPMTPGARTHTPHTRVERRHAVALQDITRVERRRVDTPATVFVALVGAGATFVTAVLVALAAGCCRW